MKITELHLENFKAWQSLDLQLGSVTGLFGTNSSGKSSILQFLLMLKQTKNSTDRGAVLELGGDIINLGTFKDIVYQHQESSSLKWRIKWNLEIPLTIFGSFSFGDKRLEIDVEVSFKQHGIKVQSLAYHFGDYTFQIKLKDSSNEEQEYQLYVKSNDKNRESFEFIQRDSPFLPLLDPIKPIKTHLFQAKNYYQNADFLGLFESYYETMIDQIYYLGPLREYPKREYQWSGGTPLDVGYRGERVIDAILAATIRGITRKLGSENAPQEFQTIIAYWLKKLGLIHSFEVKEIATGTSLYRAIVQKDEESAKVFLTDVGFGVSQVLPALVLLYYVPEHSIILMEQPEIHLHPSVQSGLADVILQVAKDRNIQVIVESHSEHLLRRFQRRIAEGTYPADELKLYFCESVKDQAKLSDLQLNAYGEIENWPENFFGDEMTEIAETRKAILKRKIQETSSHD